VLCEGHPGISESFSIFINRSAISAFIKYIITAVGYIEEACKLS
jgi:RsiW-degrading membrane proteinase PrsW (M82 family)